MKIIFKIFSVFSLSLLLASCSSDNNPTILAATIPTVSLETTSANVEKTYTTIEISGTVDDDGGDPVTARGTVWRTDPNPSLSDNFTTESSATFTSEIIDLEANTTYYFKTYATNAEGNAYSSEESFTTNSLGGTTWDFHVVYDQNTSWHGDVVFNADGTAVYDEPSSPGTYLTNGTWVLNGNDLIYDFDSSDPGNVTYTGTIEVDEMSGVFDYPNHQGTWSAIEY
ncbi:MAG: hypothetical protein RI572_07215 [Salegentibacter sp.]|uniref:hypothetical protein n=1 Tax=Salegentibacter sp. TaxID=1903072 RepID=UPI0028702D8C|nr:hypothetical protein [Salegentibacter sp.]MDR9457184.1 hypothetical protein [Salegentibacter sp.]